MVNEEPLDEELKIYLRFCEKIKELFTLSDIPQLDLIAALNNVVKKIYKKDNLNGKDSLHSRFTDSIVNTWMSHASFTDNHNLNMEIPKPIITLPQLIAVSRVFSVDLDYLILNESYSTHAGMIKSLFSIAKSYETLLTEVYLDEYKKHRYRKFSAHRTKYGATAIGICINDAKIADFMNNWWSYRADFHRIEKYITKTLHQDDLVPMVTDDFLLWQNKELSKLAGKDDESIKFDAQKRSAAIFSDFHERALCIKNCSPRPKKINNKILAEELGYAQSALTQKKGGGIIISAYDLYMAHKYTGDNIDDLVYSEKGRKMPLSFFCSTFFMLARTEYFDSMSNRMKLIGSNGWKGIFADEPKNHTRIHTTSPDDARIVIVPRNKVLQDFLRVLYSCLPKGYSSTEILSDLSRFPGIEQAITSELKKPVYNGKAVNGKNQ